MSVLLLHANVAERDCLITILCKQGFGPVQAFSAIEEFLETAACACAGQPACEAILVDVAVDSSLVACVEIRGITKVVPILVLFDESSGAHLEAAFQGRRHRLPLETH
jgi:hypothetical protein